MEQLSRDAADAAGAVGGQISCDCVAARLALQREVANLTSALQSQRTIGTVVGMIVQQHGWSSARAWEALSRFSQISNVKVRDVARIVVDAVDGQVRPEEVALLAAARAELLGCLR